MSTSHKICFLFLIFFKTQFFASGQINFKELTWAETNQMKSVHFNKPILFYFYFDGCGACNKMEKNTFQDPAVIEYLNNHYLCYKVNTIVDHKSFNDPFFNVKANPSFIFLNDSFCIQRKIAGYYEKNDFLEVAKSLFSKIEKSYAWYKDQYESGNTDKSFLLEYCNLLANTYELDTIHFNWYIENQKEDDLTTIENINFIFSYCVFQNKCLIKCNSSAFKSFYANSELYYKQFDSIQVRTRQALIMNECLLQYAKSHDSISFFELLPDIKEYISSNTYYLQTKEGKTTMIFDIPVFYDKSLELYFYDLNRNSIMYNIALEQYTDLIWEDSEILNRASWYFVDGFNDPEKLKQAEKWITRSIELSQNYYNNDTYANVLFKLGNYKQALIIAQKAVSLAKVEGEDYSATTVLIEKIKAAIE